MAITLDELKTVAKVPNLITARQFASKAVSIFRAQKQQAQPQAEPTQLQTVRTNAQIINLLEQQGVWQ